MTVTTSAHPQPGKKTFRPSVWRLLAGMYVDLLICGFVSWVVCYVFGWQSTWKEVAIVLLVCEWFWCRDRLTPTAGQYCLGIRYLTSQSSQVVADIQVINQKVKLNGFLLSAGVVDLTFAIFFFCGWTFMSQAVFWGFPISQPLSLVYWTGFGFLFFLCSGYLLSGSKLALWATPLIHGLACMELFKSYPVWKELFQSDLFYPAWVSEALMHFIRSQPFFFLELFVLWSLFVATSILFSRKHLIN